VAEQGAGSVHEVTGALVQPSFTVSHSAYTGSSDADGYPTGDAYAAPVARLAYAIYPLASQLNMTGDYDRRVVTSKIVMVPDVSPYSPRDKVVLPGSDTEYFVSEDVRDYTTGPFGYRPGGEVILEVVTG
jgi:hypothetical protein